MIVVGTAVAMIAIPALVIVLALTLRSGPVRATLSLSRFSFTLEATDSRKRGSGRRFPA